MKNLLKNFFRPEKLEPRAWLLKIKFSKIYADLTARVSVFALNARIYWVLTTTGITKKDVPFLIFIAILFLTSPLLYFIILVRLFFILFLIKLCVQFFEVFAYTLNKRRFVDQKTVEVFLAAVLVIIVIIFFKSQQHVILCQGEKQTVSLFNNMLKLTQPFIVSVDTKPLPFSPFHYVEHVYNYHVFDAMRGLLGSVHKRHEQSIFTNLFFLHTYPQLNKEYGVYTPLNPHNIMGNNQPGNDYIGKYSNNGKNVMVIAEAKSTGFNALTEKQLEGLALETQLYHFKQLDGLLVQANVDGVLNNKASANQHLGELLKQPFVQDYIGMVKKGWEFQNGVFVEIEDIKNFEITEPFIMNKTLIFLLEFRNTVIARDDESPFQLKINAVVSAWEFNKTSVVKQLVEAKLEGVNRLDILLFKKSK
jgi:hypothetical protein